MEDKTIYFLLCAYNEAVGLPQLIGEIDQLDIRNLVILVVDDGSNDGTADLLENISCTHTLMVVRHEFNMGLGCALHTGLEVITKAARGQGDCVVLTMDADLTHEVKNARLILERTSYAPVVIASRWLSDSEQFGVPVFRRIMSCAVNLLMRIIFPLPKVKDYTSGFRAFNLELVEKFVMRFGEMPVSEKGFTATPEIILKLLLQGNAGAEEVPMRLHYQKKRTKTKMKVLKTTIRYFYFITEMIRFKRHSKNFKEKCTSIRKSRTI